MPTKIIAGAPGNSQVQENLSQTELDDLTARDAAWVAGADDRKWDEIRKDRDQLLAESDWTQTADTPLTTSKQTEWSTYRQDLRDIPQTYSADPDTIVWPTKPL